MPEEYLPPVVAVVVSRDPGDHLEECLASLGGQDYASLDVLVVDDGGAGDLTARIAAVLPRAIVRRRAVQGGFAACANEALEGIEGATFFLFCHDDVALAPDAVRRLVEEAFRSNAAVVGPKLVAWDDPGRLLHVGLAVNRFGAPDARVDIGELDQAQHDEAREVFAVPAGCQLVRVDLFAALGGIDEDMASLGEDVDVCWRAQVAGARVVVAPHAVVRHLEASAVGERAPLPTRADRRDELRAVLKNYALVHRALTLLLLLAVSLVAPLSRRLSRDPSDPVRASGRWRWNAAAAHRSSLRAQRMLVRETRTVSDREIVSRMASARQHRRRRGLASDLVSAAAARAHAARDAGSRAGGAAESRLARRQAALQAAITRSGEAVPVSGGGFLAAGLLAVAVLVGVRGLLVGHLPLVGDLLPLPTGSHLLAEYFGGRSEPGWRPTQVAPPAYAVVGLLGLITGNSSAFALKLLLIAGISLGAIGSARLVADFGSRRARWAAALAFVASPVVWNSLAHGDVQASVALAVMPFVIRRLGVASQLGPFVPAHSDRSDSGVWRRFAADAVPLGLLLALGVSLAPAVLIDTGLVAVAMCLASVVVGGARGLARSLAVTLSAAAVAFACTLPWSVSWLQNARWSLFSGPVAAAGSGWSPATLLRGAAGPVGHSFLAWGLVVAAGFALVACRGSRLAWAARWWAAVIAATALAWAGTMGWLGSGGGAVLVLLAPVAVGVAACCGLGIGALDGDLARYRFGWRQGLLLGAVACFVAGLLPGAGAGLGGRGELASVGFDQTLGWMSGPPGESVGWRALWLGDPRALPGRPFQVDRGLAAFSDAAGLPAASTEWPQPNVGPAARAAAAVQSAEAGRTVQLGASLARYGIRYLVLPEAPAPIIPGEQTPARYQPPPELVRALDAQSDLRLIPVEAGVAVYRNVAWTSADGSGTIGGGASSSPGLRLAGVAGGLAVVVLAVAEGVGRRRRARRGHALDAASPADLTVGPPPALLPEAPVLQGAEP